MHVLGSLLSLVLCLSISLSFFGAKVVSAAGGGNSSSKEYRKTGWFVTHFDEKVSWRWVSDVVTCLVAKSPIQMGKIPGNDVIKKVYIE